MLTLDVLYAVLQGLPAKRLQHLKDTPWMLLCQRIEHQLQHGEPPLVALRDALKETGNGERNHLREVLACILPVMSIPHLTYRQRQALITLRYAKSISLTQLSYTLMADRSNTRRRMQVLVRRGLALKFSQPGGECYMATTTALSKDVKRGIQQILDELLAPESEFIQPVPDPYAPSARHT